MNSIKVISFLFVTFICGATSFSQNKYMPLESKGRPPSYMQKSTKENMSNQEFVLSPYEKRDVRLLEEKMYSSTYFGINEMMASGDVVYGEEVYEYVNKILEKVKSKNKIRANVVIHPFKSSYYNAFSTDIGLMFVNLGLIAKVNNETELAFVICHELAHYVLKHNLEGQIVAYKAEELADKKAITAYDKIVQKHLYSQKFEYQADSLGLIYFLQTGYSPENVLTTFEVMADPHYIPEEININEFENYSDMLKEFSQSEIDTITKSILVKERHFNEKFSTHPEIEKRKEKLEKMLSRKKNKGKKSIVSRKYYSKAKSISYLENLRVSLLEENYLDAIFYSIHSYEKTKFKEYAKIGYLRAIIGLYLKKVYDPNINPRFYYKMGLTEIHLEKESEYMDIIRYYRLGSHTQIVDNINALIVDLKSEFPDSEELKAINNWFLKWTSAELANEVTDYSFTSSLDDIVELDYSFSYEKKFFVDPNFVTIDTRGESHVNFAKTEKFKSNISKKISKLDKKSSNYINLSLANKKNIKTETLNDYSIINARMREIFSSPLITKVPPIDYYPLLDFCKENNTERVVYANGITTLSIRSPLTKLLMYYTIIGIPAGILLDLKPIKATYFEYFDLDLIEGKMSNVYYQSGRGGVSSGLIRTIYFP